MVLSDGSRPKLRLLFDCHRHIYVYILHTLVHKYENVCLYLILFYFCFDFVRRNYSFFFRGIKTADGGAFQPFEKRKTHVKFRFSGFEIIEYYFH